ncbi:ATPase [Salipaludibacillus neizhouensis]|uniref:ATPase n=1 Tax=Salipaludibacillus neizhouensis TaxID=885475 RepID=A0A3A9K5E5_9BACI|nr:BadF/BadG/BcrA/BcrD ATPase family protein [Salipaludibacillus neizhouensis]RKL66588.1 ATPase [Salipaludibacillus neizhouensis]
MAYVIGIDGGGTKTTCLFNNINDFLPHKESESLTVIGEASNPHVVGFDEMKTRLQQLIAHGVAKYSIQPNDISGVSCGLAGVGRKEDVREIEKVFQQIFFELQFSEHSIFSAHSDSYIALRGALQPGAKEGILVVSGTGSSATGIGSQGNVYKSGGWGHILGDEGSGYQIGMRALNKITKAYDMREKNTILTDLVLKELALEHPKDLISYIYGRKPEKKDIARLAKQVMEAVSHGDDVAEEILIGAANELVSHVESLHKKCPSYNERTPIMTTGSIFTYSKDLERYFIDNIHLKKLGFYQTAYSSPVYGAAMIARENCTDIKKS